MQILKAHSVSTGAIALGLILGASSASAQEAPAEKTKAEEIIVTGTRIQQTGFSAPTPTTVLGETELKAAAPKNIDDFMNQVPAVAGSMTLGTRQIQASNGTNGISTPSLRGVGTNRTLVLLNGHRSPTVTQTGETDVNGFPDQLIKRVDVVTGGASAVYGSDALSGVVNFVLDTKFNGLKAEASGGVTTYGDDFNYKMSATFGTKFADGRGHLLISGLHQWNQGIGKCLQCVKDGTPPSRSWLYGAPILVNNPAYVVGNGAPQYISGIGASAGVSPGGIITGGPLKGTAFTTAGTPYNFNYGTVDSAGQFMIGGDWRNTDVTALTGVDPVYDRSNVYARADFDLTDKINIFAEYGFNHTYTYGNHSTKAFFGAIATGIPLTVKSDNAYLPSSVKAAMATAGVTSAPYGMFSPSDPQGGVAYRDTYRFLTGASGKFDAFGDELSWNFYYQRGVAKVHEQVAGSYKIANLAKAVDAVVNPANGQIVCRSTLSNPNDGCHPLNIFGFNPSIDPAVKDYAFGRPDRWETFTQDVVSFDISGKPFNLPAGPVGMAMGVEHRREKAAGTVDALSATGTSTTGWSTNYLPLNGSYNVTEGFVEVDAPLLKDKSFVRSLDFNGAARFTSYSTSGFVVTWKGGITWEPVEGIRFRATQSRDIRAPSLSELYTKGLFITAATQDPWNGNSSNAAAIQFQTGNPNLRPEKADTTGIGVVIEPRQIPGLHFAVDYWRISIKDSISSYTAQTVVNQCFSGNSNFCSGVIRTPNTTVNGVLGTWVTQVNVQPFNAANEMHNGIDFEASYRHRLFDGMLSLRGLLTRNLHARLDNGLSGPYEYVGEYQFLSNTPSIGSLPKWKYSLTATYDSEVWSTSWTLRGFSAGNWWNNRVGCTSACPLVSSLPTNGPASSATIDNNTAPAAAYVDMSLTIKPKLDWHPEIFFSVKNLFNKDPALQPRGPGGLSYGTLPTNPSLYDIIGRAYTLGVRVRM